MKTFHPLASAALATALLLLAACEPTETATLPSEPGPASVLLVRSATLGECASAAGASDEGARRYGGAAFAVKKASTKESDDLAARLAEAQQRFAELGELHDAMLSACAPPTGSLQIEWTVNGQPATSHCTPTAVVWVSVYRTDMPGFSVNGSAACAVPGAAGSLSFTVPAGTFRVDGVLTDPVGSHGQQALATAAGVVVIGSQTTLTVLDFVCPFCP